jgi:hypothetical protein
MPWSQPVPPSKLPDQDAVLSAALIAAGVTG